MAAYFTNSSAFAAMTYGRQGLQALLGPNTNLTSDPMDGQTLLQLPEVSIVSGVTNCTQPWQLAKNLMFLLHSNKQFISCFCS